MKERPILFSSEMVRAILSGSKTQTRRVLKPQPVGRLWNPPSTPPCLIDDTDRKFPCPYGQPGNRLIVAMGIPSFGRNYCAGSNGIIYSRARGDWRALKAHGNQNGYPSVTVIDGARKTTRSVHSLVCEAFYGPAPFNGAQVRHLDGNRQNSIPENLLWGTQAENWQDRRYHGNGMEGEKHHASKLSDVERAHIRWAINNKLCSQRHIAKMLNVTPAAIHNLMYACETKQTDQVVPDNRIPCITLEITGVRVERLHDISEADAKAEGIYQYKDGGFKIYTPTTSFGTDHARRSFESLWESINGDDSWTSNPWVWVIEFKRVT